MRYQINAPNVVAENIDGESVILNMETGKYYSAVQLGAIAWQFLSGAFTIEEASEMLSSHYTVPNEGVNEDLSVLLKQLIDNNLIKPSDATAPTASVDLTLSKVYSPPKITTYNDMEGLLLLDPIHEVENMGWPKTKEDPDAQ